MGKLLHWVLRAPPFPHERRTAAGAMTLLWLVGGATTLLVTYLPHPSVMRVDVVLAVGCTSPVVALLIHLLRDRSPAWVYPWVLAGGTGVVTVLVAAGGGGSASVSFSFFYTWVAVYALLFFRPVVAALQIVLAATAYGMVMVRMGSFTDGAITAVEPIVLTAVVVTTGAVVLLLSHARGASELDPLTGVANRRGLDRVLDEAMDRSVQNGSPLALAVIDVDHFKQINDLDGHQAGDRVLQELVGRWRAVLRATDTLARFGGDEFVVVLPACAARDGAVIAERLRAAAPDGITCSVGVAEMSPDDSASMLLTRADWALYEAKRLGRDRLAWAADDAAQIFGSRKPERATT